MELKLNAQTILCSSILPFSQMKGNPKFCMKVSNPYLTREQTTSKKPLVHRGNKLKFKVTKPVPPEKVEIFKSMENWASENVLTLLKPVEKSWQPQDLLPDPTSKEFIDQIQEVRKRTQEVPDDYFVVLVGNMITEEALPTYQSHFSTVDVFGDSGCTGTSPWAIWTRGWGAEENRHGDLLNKYLYLSGRVDMKQIEKTIHYLIGRGMDIGVDNNPYLWIIYTSFQERATAIAHGNTGKLALRYGDTHLAKICGTIAADEKRHEAAYSKIAKKLFELDPSETMVALAQNLRNKVVFPSELMYDGQDNDLYANLSSVTERIGVYSNSHHIETLEHFVDAWNLEKLIGLSSEGRQAQDYVCELARKLKLRVFQERAQGDLEVSPTKRFSWIFNKEVML
ncbi:hypothetical protein Tsubulata_026045 [Turnera subulata]|uniref:Acyl-[acyl-carrier-protein] desaturase n=1 Tax=Turnera subulata TaxID=218843 RepID=A0A9Q0G6V9_9ROSI|nr:hypothetical protein Tsubulata_026045 [Turnera subulata]